MIFRWKYFLRNICVNTYLCHNDLCCLAANRVRFVPAENRVWFASRHFILIANFRSMCSLCEDVPAHLWSQQSNWQHYMTTVSLLSLSLSPSPSIPVLSQADCRSREYLRIHFPAADTWIKQQGRWQNVHHTRVHSHALIYTLTQIACVIPWQTVREKWFAQS